MGEPAGFGLGLAREHGREPADMELPGECWRSTRAWGHTRMNGLSANSEGWRAAGMRTGITAHDAECTFCQACFSATRQTAPIIVGPSAPSVGTHSRSAVPPGARAGPRSRTARRRPWRPRCPAHAPRGTPATRAAHPAAPAPAQRSRRPPGARRRRPGSGPPAQAQQGHGPWHARHTNASITQHALHRLL